MSRELKKALFDWLSAEGRADEPDSGHAESNGHARRALERVFELVPVPSPSPAFVRRTLMRAGLSRRFSHDLSSRWIRAGVAASLVLAAAALILMPGILAPLLSGGFVTKSVGLAIGFSAAILHRLAEGLAVWDVLSRMGGAAADTAASPAALAAMSAAFLVSYLSFRWLDQIVAAERRTRHA